MSDLTEQWCERVRAAATSGTALQLRGGATKGFYGRNPAGEVFDTRGHAGVVSYEPTELVVTVRAGTPLAALEALLAERNQMLAFEPPHFGAGATVGGCVAAGLSGPRRHAAGALRDFVLGVKIIDGRGDVLSFGGQVMKNVAGYDVSRAIAGSLGTLGLILDVSLKVLPRPVAETTLRFAMGEKEAIDRLNDWGGQPLPLSASAWCEGALHLRLSGAEAAVRSAERKLGGEVLAADMAGNFWQSVREHTDDFFATATAPGEVLWRLSLPSSAAPVKLAGQQFIEWGGALRWLRSDAAADTIRERVASLGGHATAFRGFDREGEVFHPLAAPLMVIHGRLKQAFDPAGIFNPGRFYNGL
ncbi:glycolate oxidase subunit GlcE [Aromatoleum diolicum]|uniref:Glycolate oxidase subunit GlcE n=1 Tax=Aromatoleum diolicum TaxID=75796 RepID=A0ABX1QDA4_9RHOO|nr:glycolate oxidase subunit GlcE [Aromatoleum diolicum]NMG76278.1 glycolate oxidase subunit GlcE [Aromatoleum diolicum]